MSSDSHPPPANAGFNAALQRPVTNLEPDFLRAVPIDNLVGALVALTSEVYVLRERLQTLEAELSSRRVLPEGAVENHVDSPDEQQRRATDLAAYTNRVLSELARDRVPVSSIDERVAPYLKTHAEVFGKSERR
jgi:hypothetical protein